MELSGVVLEAFIEHLRDQHRRELMAELEAAERAAWAPIREQLQHTRGQRTHAELAERRREYPPLRELRATEDWTPVQIPGRPGWWRHYINGQQVDLPSTSIPRSTAA